MTDAVVSTGGAGRLARFVQFLTDVRAEIAKVTWPTMEELRRATLVIVLFVAFVGLLIGLMDVVLQAVFITGIPGLFR